MAVVGVASVACPVCVVVSLLLLVFLIIKKIKMTIAVTLQRFYTVFFTCAEVFALPYFVSLVLGLFFR